MNLWPKVAEPEVKEEVKTPEKSMAEVIAESIAAAQKPLMDKLEAYNERFQTLENQTKPREPKTVSEPNQTISVLDDENAAFAQRMTPLLARQLELESKIVKNEIKQEYVKAGFGDLWAQYENEINQTLDSADLVTASGQPLRGNPQYIRNVVDMVLGRAARTGGIKFDGKSKGFFLEPATGSVNGSHEPEADGLNDNQRKIMQRMGIPVDDAKKVVKKLHFVN